MLDPAESARAASNLSRRRAVFLSYYRTTFTDALRAAVRLQEHGAYEPIFVISANRPLSLEQEVHECQRRGISCFKEEELLAGDAPLAFVGTEGRRAHVSSLWVARRLIVKLREQLGLLWALVPRLLGKRQYEAILHPLRQTAWGRWLARERRRHMVRRLRRPGCNGFLESLLKAELRYRIILLRLKADVVCLSEDIPGFHSGPLIRAARRKATPSIVIPFTISNVLETAESRFSERISWFAWINYYAAGLAYPRWSLIHKGRRLLRAHPGLIHATELRGIAPPNPWLANSGHADRIAVESERMLKLYRDNGFPERQLVLTGSCADDFLSTALREKASRREAVYRELRLPAKRRLLLSSLVPDQLVSGVPECEFTQYRELIEFWVRTLANWTDRVNVVLKINPRYRREEFLFLEEWGVTVAPQDTIELVPLADIYVASISSTLRWAAACGIPSINYDVYHYRYGDFSDAPGIIHVEKKLEYVTEVARLIEDDEYWAERCRQQMLDAGRWAMLDGKSTERLVKLFDGLITVPPHLRSLHEAATSGF